MVSFLGSAANCRNKHDSAMQSQIVCSGCRSVLLYPRGALEVRCAICSTITRAAPGMGMDMAQLLCCGCRTMLMYARGATSVRCSCCNTINHTISANQVSHVNCGNCRVTLMYPYGASSVKCAMCHYITHVGMPNMRTPAPEAPRPNETAPIRPSTSVHSSRVPNTTVVVENPMSVNESGKLVSNVVVGVTTGKK
ncbi:protein LOL2-like isoform X2 [Curcuma longa]|uniref:protein LOL2-like isoform X2 n=2 Tax=Curcuma longa TaxID=136217 RepID=UPI003D9F7EE6